MAQVIIARRREPVILPNERAKQLKQTLLNTQDKSTMVDLGSWMGALSEIKSIEIEDEQKSNFEPVSSLDDDKYKAERERFNKLPAETKARMLSEFSVNYQMKNGWKKPEQEVLQKGYERQLEYYKSHPTAQFVPKEFYLDLLQ